MSIALVFSILGMVVAFLISVLGSLPRSGDSSAAAGTTDESFQVEQIDHDLEITSPTADTTIKANTDLTVRWTSKKGLAANEKVIVSLRRRYIFSNSFFFRG